MAETKPNLVEQYKILVVIWAGLLMSQFLLLFVVFMTKRELFDLRFDQSVAGQSGAMIAGFGVAALTCVFFSFAFKKRFFERAVEQQDPSLVQTGLVIALALSEASTLIGLCLAFAFDYQYFFAWFALGILAMLLHFPRQSDLLAAGFKNR